MSNTLSSYSPSLTQLVPPAPSSALRQTSLPATAQDLLPKAKEFESILLSQWLQGAESSFGTVPGAADDGDAGDEQFKSFAVQQLAKAFTDGGGVGIAKEVAKALGKSQDAAARPSSHDGYPRHVTKEL